MGPAGGESRAHRTVRPWGGKAGSVLMRSLSEKGSRIDHRVSYRPPAAITTVAPCGFSQSNYNICGPDPEGAMARSLPFSKNFFPGLTWEEGQAG